MRKLKIYLDTSVINFLYADDAPEFRKITLDFFNQFVKTEKYVIYLSDVVLGEIEKTKDPHRKDLLTAAARKYGKNIYPLDEEADRLAVDLWTG